MANRPQLELVAVNKADKTKRYPLMGLWDKGGWHSGTLDRNVQEIVLTDGTILTNDGVWFNLRVPKEQQQATPF